MSDRPMPDCVITFAVPAALEQDVLDLLLARPDDIVDLSILHGEAPGARAPLPTAMEKVRGRARRSLLVVVTWQAHAGSCSAAVVEAFPGAAISWWSSPLSGWGGLAHGGVK